MAMACQSGVTEIHADGQGEGIRLIMVDKSFELGVVFVLSHQYQLLAEFLAFQWSSQKGEKANQLSSWRLRHPLVSQLLVFSLLSR